MMTVSVPATSANLGPGFDCLGLAVDLLLKVRASLSERDSLHYSGEGQVADSPDNLIHKGFRAAYAAAGQPAPAVSFSAQNPIPLARGLGSSSAALVAGAALADGFMGEPLGRDGVFALTAALEGHPDNVAPAVYGGFTVSALSGGRYTCEVLEIPPAWRLLFAVPDFELLTSEARAVLPQDYSRADAIFTASRTALWTLAVVQNKPELLRVASEDVLHEPYREGLIPGFAACRQRLREVGAQAAYLSGAGPTLAAITGDAEVAERCLAIMDTWGARVLELRAAGGYCYGGVAAPAGVAGLGHA